MQLMLLYISRTGIVMSAGIVKELIDPSEYSSATVTGNMDNSVSKLWSRGMVATAT